MALPTLLADLIPARLRPTGGVDTCLDALISENGNVTTRPTAYAQDSAPERKSRGAFFTPTAVAQFMAEWAIKSSSDRVLEPSAGDAEFMVAAALRLRELGSDPESLPEVHGVEIHRASAAIGRERVEAAGARAKIKVRDFFEVSPDPTFDAVIGNPPYIRYQRFSGDDRAKARAAAELGGVVLNGLASSWAAFTVYSTMFLKPGGRLALVLPAELLSVNYAAPVRQFLFDRFSSVDLVLFEQQIFADAEADVVLLLAGGFQGEPAKHATVHQAKNAEALGSQNARVTWTPSDPADKWTHGLVASSATAALARLERAGSFTPLQSWGETTLGIVTGNNQYFAMSATRAAQAGLADTDLLPLSPPGSRHLRGLSLSRSLLDQLMDDGKSVYLFKPTEPLSESARAYVEAGKRVGVDSAYKCRVRSTWYQVPVIPPADLLLTCMNADTPRLTTNAVRAYHLNSVHGVYLAPERAVLGRRMLPLASLNSATVLHAELVGRAYGGGVLKLEPREADRWLVPSPELVAERADALAAVRRRVERRLDRGDLLGAVALVDEALFAGSADIAAVELQDIRRAREELSNRRLTRGKSRG